MTTQISVIMACYNCEKTLSKAIDSILAQTYTNWMLICCDDGSEDGTYRILKQYKEKYPDKFIIIQNDKNRKLAYSLNRCLEYVNTEFVARMDADDESFPERFSKQIEFLTDHPEYIVCGTKIRINSELSKRQYISDIDEHPDRYTLYRHTPFNHATIMCRKEMYELLDGYTDTKTTVRCEDKDLWYRFFEKGLVGANLMEPLYRIVEDKAMIFRSTQKSRWNGFLTELRGYQKLRYPWYWYYKPFINLAKIIIPRSAVVFYYKKFRK